MFSMGFIKMICCVKMPSQSMFKKANQFEMVKMKLFGSQQICLFIYLFIINGFYNKSSDLVNFFLKNHENN